MSVQPETSDGGVLLERDADVPELRPRLLIVRRPADGWPALEDEELAPRVAAVARGELEAVKDEPPLRAYRDFYWSLGIDPTKRRPSAEALIRRAHSGKRWPRIHAVVDRYNIVSAEQRVAIGGYDLDAVRALAGTPHGSPLRLRLRHALPREAFLGIGMQCHIDLTGKELVLDAGGAAFAVYPHRDGHRTRLQLETSAALLICCDVPGFDPVLLDAAADALRQELGI